MRARLALGVLLAGLGLAGAASADPLTYQGNPVGGVLLLCSSADGKTADLCAKGVPTETTTSIGTTATPFGLATPHQSMGLQAQGSSMCVTFGSTPPTPPTSADTCAVGAFLVAGQPLTYGPGASGRGMAAAATAGGQLWESVQ